MNNKVAHGSVVDRPLGRAFPGRIGCRIVGEDPNNVEAIEIAEGMALECFEFATKNEMQQLFAGSTSLGRHAKALSRRRVEIIMGRCLTRG
jgi:hypothetical protein